MWVASLSLLAVILVRTSAHEYDGALVDVAEGAQEDSLDAIIGEDDEYLTQRPVATMPARRVSQSAATCQASYYPSSHWTYVIINGAKCHLHTPIGNGVRSCKGGCRSWDYNMPTISNTLGAPYNAYSSRCFCCKYKYQSITVSACCKKSNGNGTVSDIELQTSVHMPTSCSCQMCVNDATTTTTPATTTTALPITVKLSMKIDKPWNNSYSDPTSAPYKALEATIGNDYLNTNVAANVPGYIGATLTGMSPGSINTHWDVMVDASQEGVDVAGNLANAVNNTKSAMASLGLPVLSLAAGPDAGPTTLAPTTIPPIIGTDESTPNSGDGTTTETS